MGRKIIQALLLTFAAIVICGACVGNIRSYYGSTIDEREQIEALRTAAAKEYGIKLESGQKIAFYRHDKASDYHNEKLGDYVEAYYPSPLHELGDGTLYADYNNYTTEYLQLRTEIEMPDSVKASFVILAFIGLLAICLSVGRIYEHFHDKSVYRRIVRESYEHNSWSD